LDTLKAYHDRLSDHPADQPAPLAKEKSPAKKKDAEKRDQANSGKGGQTEVLAIVRPEGKQSAETP
jgi:hypothetical protein